MARSLLTTATTLILVLMLISSWTSMPSFAGETGPDWSHIETLLETHPDRALDLLDKWEAQPDTVGRVLTLQTRAYTRMKRAKEAIATGKKAISQAPDTAQAHLAYANALLLRISKEPMFAMANTGRYLKSLDRAIDLEPTEGEAWIHKAMFYLEAPAIAGGSKAKAVNIQEKLAKISEPHAILVQLAILAKEDKTKEQEPLLERLLVLDPESSAFAVRYGDYLRRHERHAEAIAVYGPRTAEEPDDWRLLFGLASARISGRQDVARGVREMTRYAERKPEYARGPSSASAWVWVGWGHYIEGDSDRARAAYEKALELDPKHRSAKEKLAELESN
ncbi:Tetratricopeptide repeat protein [Sulfidibacter corallicola]|uniref:Tetratricopeptide repeat protein n=1 Tax=Sulfidibacter corallicola TaxID=2818388 RepID=A0A8A4TRT8_SULCO|nr:tetratricopeptide repeat protein [Sulfidibacter corallicola]QTD51884.1 tetratricopeptide repeat protein [Sulfidibacter corallicola]